MVNSVADALAALDVTDGTLSDDERRSLDERGFVLLPDILRFDQIYGMRIRIQQLLDDEGADAGKEVHQEAGTDRLADLVNKDPMFSVCFTHPRLLAAVAHVLGPEFKLHSLNYRAALPGQGHQALHADYGEAVEPGDYRVVNSGWLLDDFTEENGPTRLVPGSHRSGTVPSEAMNDPEAPHPDEVLALAPAGSALVFNSHTWHGGTTNRTERPRRVIHCAWVRRDLQQQTDQQAMLRPGTYERLSPAARYLLDVVQP
jgi:hypothetical protein